MQTAQACCVDVTSSCVCMIVLALATWPQANSPCSRCHKLKFCCVVPLCVQELIPELSAAVEGAGLKWSDFKVTDNSCQPHPPARSLVQVRAAARGTCHGPGARKMHMVDGLGAGCGVCCMPAYFPYSLIYVARWVQCKLLGSHIHLYCKYTPPMYRTHKRLQADVSL